MKKIISNKGYINPNVQYDSIELQIRNNENLEKGGIPEFRINV